MNSAPDLIVVDKTYSGRQKAAPNGRPTVASGGWFAWIGRAIKKGLQLNSVCCKIQVIKLHYNSCKEAFLRFSQ
jgi:hypothetical protein